MDISSGFITLLTVYSISIPTQTKLTNAETYTLNIIYYTAVSKSPVGHFLLLDLLEVNAKLLHVSY